MLPDHPADCCLQFRCSGWHPDVAHSCSDVNIGIFEKYRSALLRLRVLRTGDNSRNPSCQSGRGWADFATSIHQICGFEAENALFRAR